MNYFKRLASKTNLMTKIAIPIVVLGLLSAFVISHGISNLLYGYTTQSLKAQTQSISNKVYYLIESEFKTLFFSYGQFRDGYLKAKKVSQAELIGSLRNIFKQSIYDIAIITPTKTHWISHNHVDKSILKSIDLETPSHTFLASNYVISTLRFRPWEWYIVTIQDRSSVVELIKQNRYLVIKNISLLIVLVILALIIILYLTIERPFGVIFAHLNRIKNNDIVPLELSSSQEVVKLVENINTMSNQILHNQNELQFQKTKLQRIMDIQPDILIVTNGKAIQSVNASFFNFFDQYTNLEEFTREHQCVCDFFEKIEEEDYIYAAQNQEWISKVLANHRLYKVKIFKKNQAYIFSIKVERFDTQNYVVNLGDITQLEEYKRELERKQDRLIHQLYTDSLTHLPNRIKLTEDIKTYKSPMIILINIDGFKEINDFYGIDIGDFVLIEFGKIIKRHLPFKSAKLYKMSGDEYVVLDSMHLSRMELIKQLNLLSNSINNQTIFSNGYEIDMNATMGVSLDTQELLISADVALHEAKNSKLRFAIYDKSFETLKEYKNNLLWSKKIKEAIESNKIVPYFQPIVDNQTHQIVKYESLVRLISSNNQIIAPFVFLGIAKQSRIYHNISKIMIEQTFKYFANKAMDFSINISINDIENFETHQFIFEQLKIYDLGSRVTFEILESEGITNYGIVGTFITEVKQYGAKIAIDDFGTGYSNFSHIINLNVDFIKIDGSLINTMLHDENLRVVVETIVTFAKKLGIKTVAEFVDSKELYEYVVAIGIDYSQGFYISKPKPDIINQAECFKKSKKTRVSPNNKSLSPPT